MSRAVAALFAVVALLSTCTDQPGRDQSRSSTPLPDVAEVACTEGGPRLGHPTVQAQADGVHFRVVNRTREDFLIRLGDGGEWPISRDPDSLTLAIAPGSIEVACHPEGTHERDREPTETLRIVDPEGLFRHGELACDESWHLFTHGARSLGHSVERAVQRVLKPHLGRVEFKPTGYPEETEAAGGLLLLRGKAVAVLTFVRGPGGDLYFSGASGCPEGQRLLR
jgi:hypothetical protein